LGIYFINNFIGTNLNSIIDVEDNTEIDIELISGGITIYKDNRSLGLKLLADGTIHKILFTNDLKVSGIGILFVNEIEENTSQQETIYDTYHVSTLPTITSDILGSIKQYIGTTNSNYTKGYFYEAQSVLTNTPQEESLTVTQTAGVTMGEFTTNASVFKHQLQPDRDFVFTFSKVGKPKEISVWKMIGGMEFSSFTRDTVYDNSRLHQYSWVDGSNNFYFTNTEIPNTNTKFYPSSSGDITVPDSTPSDWEYISTSTRRTDDPWGMWMIGGDETPIELSDYGIYSSSSGVTGCVLSVDYKQQIYPIYDNRWVNINVQPEEER